jgi:ribosomal protein S7
MEQNVNKNMTVEKIIYSKDRLLEKQLYNKLVGALIKKGYKITAIKILSKALYTLKKKTGYSFAFLVWNLFSKLQVNVEIRTVLVKGRSHLVPFKVKAHRKFYLVTKWITNAILEKTKKQNIVDSIVEEFLFIYTKNKASKALAAKATNLEKALLNRANLHYRW